MADIDIKRHHSLGMKGAREAADKMAHDLGKKFGLTGGWTGDTHHFDRPGVTGSLHLGANELHLTVKLGFLLKAMRGPLEAAIVRELDALFASQTPEKLRAAKAAAGKRVSPKKGSDARKKAG